MANVFGVKDAKFFPLTAEGDLCETGGIVNPTYGDGIDIPGIQSMTWEAELTEAENNGDDDVCCEISRPKLYNISLEHCGIDPAFMAEVFGHTQETFTDSGANADAVATMINRSDAFQYGALVVQAVGCDDASDVHVIFWKVRLRTGPGGTFAFEDFYNSAYEATAKSGPVVCGEFYRILEHPSEAIDIPTTFPVADFIADTNY